MTAPILVAYATRYGSTREATDTIAVTLREHGLTADVRPASDVAGLDGYGAVVLGAPLYIGRLHGDFRTFLLWHREELEKRPVAVFALGPLHDDPTEIAGSSAALNHELAKYRWLKPVATQVFIRRYDSTHLGFIHRMMAALPETPLHELPATDERNLVVTEAWADRLASTLEVVCASPNSVPWGERHPPSQGWSTPATPRISLDTRRYTVSVEHAFYMSSYRRSFIMTSNDLPEQTSNPVKDPEDWTTGDEPMTGPQASYLQTLLQQAGRPESDLDPNLTKAKASEMIDELQKETGRGQS